MATGTIHSTQLLLGPRIRLVVSGRFLLLLCFDIKNTINHSKFYNQKLYALQYLPISIGPIRFFSVYIITAEYFEHLGLLLALKKHNLLEKGEPR